MKRGIRLAAARVLALVLPRLQAPMMLLPRRNTVALISRESTEVSTDYRLLVSALKRADPDVRLVLIPRESGRGAFRWMSYTRHLLRQLYHFATARAVVLERSSVALSVPPRHRARVVQIWHALGAYKKVGYSILGTPEGEDPDRAAILHIHRGYDLVTVSAEICRPYYAQAFATDIAKILVCPLPRVDLLIDEAHRKEIARRFATRYPDEKSPSRPIALYSPTHTATRTFTRDVGLLERELSSRGWRLVAKPHPLAPASLDRYPGFSSQDLTAVADSFITDFSATLFEATLCALPCYFLMNDETRLAAQRGTYLPLEDLPGPRFEDAAALAAAVAAGESSAESAKRFADRWIQIPQSGVAAASTRPCSDTLARLVLLP